MSSWKHVILEVMEWDKNFPIDGSTPADWVADPEKYGVSKKFVPMEQLMFDDMWEYSNDID